MNTRSDESDLSGSEPLPPDHSLPSYGEPTPETHRRISREEEAELALNNTSFSPGVRPALIMAFLLTLLAIPAIQLFAEFRTGRRGERLPTAAIFQPLIRWEKILAATSARDFWRLLPQAQELKSVEKTLESDSAVSQWLLPRVQSVLTGALGTGNEQAYQGRDRWLFYRPDVDYLIGPPFLSPQRLKKRRVDFGVQPNPVEAIVDFRDQLAAREIELVVMPLPVKPAVDAEMLSKKVKSGVVLQNPSFTEFKERLTQAGVRMFDPAPILLKMKAARDGAPLYLETDTHWRPETMEFVARELAAFLKVSSAAPQAPLRVLDKEVSALGDVAVMLRLPRNPTIFARQAVTIHQVTLDTGLWRPDKTSDVLLLGDSFSNIYSLEAMGWGESAGLAEHLSRFLHRRAIDCIVRNSDGAFATREILSQELARGRDRLSGKKLVVLEFVARELAFGNWKLLPMKLRQARPEQAFHLHSGEEALVTGTIEAVSPIPRPGAVPYKDHILALHLVDIENDARRANSGRDAVVYLWSMRDNVWTQAARLRVGDKIAVRLRPWDDVSAEFDKFNRSEIDDIELQKEEPLWGEFK